MEPRSVVGTRETCARMPQFEQEIAVGDQTAVSEEVVRETLVFNIVNLRRGLICFH